MAKGPAATITSKVSTPVVVTVSGAASAQASTANTSFTVSDTAANVQAGLTALLADSKLTSITLTDTSKPTLTLTQTAFAADTAVLAKIATAYNLVVTGATAAQAAALQAAAPANASLTFTVVDTAANVAANLSSLASDTKLSTITLTDSTKPTLTLTATAIVSGLSALGKIKTAYTLAVSGTATAAQATVLQSVAAIAALSFTVADTAANVAANLSSLVSNTKVSAITLTNSAQPTLTLTQSAYAADTAALAKITTAYNLVVTGATVAQAAALQAAAPANASLTFTVVDTAANVAANLSSLVSDTKVSAITLTDSAKPTLTLTQSAFVADTTALAKITTAYNLAVTGATVAQAAALQATSLANASLTFTVVDTAANVAANLSSLVSDTKVSAITLTDSAKPTLTLTQSAFAADTTALAKITTPYNLVVTGATAAQAAAIQAASLANATVSFTIADTAANVQANLAALLADTRLTSITLTDVGQATITLTQAAATADAALLAKITTPYNLVIAPWYASLNDTVLKADFTSFSTAGALTETEMAKALGDLTAELTSGKTLSASQFADLKSIASNIASMGASSYVQYITNALVNGNAANATWMGGGTSSVTLGNLATGASATQLSELTGKWFLGTDLPSTKVSMSGSSTFSVTYSAESLPLYGSGGPSMNDINQGYLGDCYLESAMAEVASKNPSLITNMITNNGNGTYGVRLFVGGAAEYVTVANLLADGGTEFNTSSNGLWASIVEQAYAQIQAGGNITGNGTTYYNKGNNFSTIGNGGPGGEYTLAELTGATQVTDFNANGSTWTSYTYNTANFTANSALGNDPFTTLANIATASLLSTIVSDLAAGDDVLLGSSTDATDSSGKTTLVSGHELSIYGYDTATGLLEVRNPWGSMSGQYWDTTFEVSLSTLLSDGDQITIDNAGTSALGKTTAVSSLSTPSQQLHATQLGGAGTALGLVAPQNLLTQHLSA